MLNIQPIKLLAGCHQHTGQTGQGCFLNVCSYLQGDHVITDKPSSVHAGLRKPIMALNDFAPSDEQRQRLVPFVHRAMLTGGKEDSALEMGGRYLCHLIVASRESTLEPREFDAALRFLDALLPHDEPPSAEVAKRAADLALARAEWGDKPLPKPRDLVEYKTTMPWFGVSAPGHAIGVDFAEKYSDSNTLSYKATMPQFEKKNKPHGPIKPHKPAYF
jgi:hypothetical protein